MWLFVMPFFTIAGLGSMTTPDDDGGDARAAGDRRAGSRAGDHPRRGRHGDRPDTDVLHRPGRPPRFGPETVGTVARCMTYGGQIPRTIDAWAGPSPYVVWGTYWGQSELSQLGTVGWFRTLEDIPGGDPTWIGKPVTHLEIRVAGRRAGKDADRSASCCCRTPSAMLGYYKDPERTAEVFRDGWVHTGDMVRRDGDGNLFFHDRLKDIIKSGGMNVSSQEVERVLKQHPAVFRAAVVGCPTSTGPRR